MNSARQTKLALEKLFWPISAFQPWPPENRLLRFSFYRPLRVRCRTAPDGQSSKKKARLPNVPLIGKVTREAGPSCAGRCVEGVFFSDPSGSLQLSTCFSLNFKLCKSGQQLLSSSHRARRPYSVLHGVCSLLSPSHLRANSTRATVHTPTRAASTFCARVIQKLQRTTGIAA